MEMIQQPQIITDSEGKQLAVISLTDYNTLLAKSELYDTINAHSFNIPEEHREEIELGREDIKNGRFKTREEVRAKALKLCIK